MNLNYRCGEVRASGERLAAAGARGGAAPLAAAGAGSGRSATSGLDAGGQVALGPLGGPGRGRGRARGVAVSAAVAALLTGDRVTLARDRVISGRAAITLRVIAAAARPLPRVLLERLGAASGPLAPSAGDGGRTVNESNRAQVQAEEAARRAGEVRARDHAWQRDERARLATAQGMVAPPWRALERQLTLSFKPPASLLHDAPAGKVARAADRAGTFLKQMYAAWRRGEEGLRRPVVPGSRAVDAPPGWSIDPSVQGYPGEAPGMNLRHLQTEQALAVQRAWGAPTEWRRVVIEVETGQGGGVVSARIVSASGRGAFDRFALEEVKRRVAVAPIPAEPSVSRWVCEAAYSVQEPQGIGGTFDENALFERAARRNNSLRLPLSERVQTRVKLELVRKAE